MPVEEVLSVRITGDTADIESKARQLTATMETLQAKIGARKDFLLRETDIGKIAQYNREIEILSGEVTRIQNVGKQGFDTLGSAVEKSSLSVNGLYGGLRKLAYILPGIGVAGIIGFATEGALKLIQNLRGVTQSAEEAKAALKEYVDELGDTTKYKLVGDQNAQKDLTNLQLLYFATQNHTLALSDRKKAVDALQAQYPAYFKNMSDEAILAGGAEKAYYRLRDSIVATARARAAEEMLVDNRKQQITLEQRLTDLIDSRVEAEDRLRRFQAANPLSSSMQGVQGINTKNLQILTETAKVQSDIDNKSKQTAETVRQLNELYAKGRSLEGEINVPALIDKPGAAPKADKRQFNFFDRFFDTDPKTASEKAKQATEMYKTAMEFALKNMTVLKGLDKITIAPTQEAAMEAARKWWSDFQKGLIGLNLKFPASFHMIPPDVPKDDADLYMKIFREQLKKIAPDDKGTEAVLGLPKNPDELGRKLEELLKRARKAGLSDSAILKAPWDTDKGGKDLTKMIDGFEKLSGIVSGTLQPAFESAFSELFRGGNFMESLFEGIGKSVEQLIAKLATAAALSAIISAIVPGSSFSGSFGKFSGLGGGLPGFASGGAVTGPTGAWIGEGNLTSHANPEVIMPANSLRRMIGSGGGFPDFVPVLRGDQLLLMNKRAQNKQGRTT